MEKFDLGGDTLLPPTISASLIGTDVGAYVGSDQAVASPIAMPGRAFAPIGPATPHQDNYMRQSSLTLDSIRAGNLNTAPQSWYDLAILQPIDPRHLIADARLDNSQGTFVRSSSFLVTTWATGSTVLTGSTTCQAWQTDNLMKVEDAEQWNLAHQGGNFTSSVAPPLRRIVFLRGGREWRNELFLNFGPTVYNDVQLSFRDNAASSGNFSSGGSATVPAYKWSGAFTAAPALSVSLKQFGRFLMALKLTDSLGNNTMWEMEWIVVP